MMEIETTFQEPTWEIGEEIEIAKKCASYLRRLTKLPVQLKRIVHRLVNTQAFPAKSFSYIVKYDFIPAVLRIFKSELVKC